MKYTTLLAQLSYIIPMYIDQETRSAAWRMRDRVRFFQFPKTLIEQELIDMWKKL